jgi:V/A-type H+-transporting ATPase subunit I
MANVKWDFSPMVAQVATWITIIGAVGIVATSGRESRNPVKRILKGIFALYNNATGYLSDILSYSRLLALGLATGIIANVVNQMGTMAGGGIGGAILFIVVFLLGHTMNIGINMLGAYVHTVRLQYVEFFGKFYEGGGTKFHPFGIHTKFFKFRED